MSRSLSSLRKGLLAGAALSLVGGALGVTAVAAGAQPGKPPQPPKSPGGRTAPLAASGTFATGQLQDNTVGNSGSGSAVGIDSAAVAATMTER